MDSRLQISRAGPIFRRCLPGRESVGTVVSSHSTGRDVAIVAVPVMVNGTVTGVLGASVYLDSITTYVQDSLGLPDTVQFFAIDPAGNIALHSNDEQIFQNNMSAGTAQPGSVGAAVNAMLAEKAGTISVRFRRQALAGSVQYLFPDRLAYCRRVCGYSVDRVEMTGIRSRLFLELMEGFLIRPEAPVITTILLMMWTGPTGPRNP